jgi:WD40 repeat protein
VTPDGGQAIWGSRDGSLKVWDLRTGQVRTLAGHRGTVEAVAFAPEDGQAVSASIDHTVKVWNLETGAVVATFTCEAAAMCCTFAGERRIIAGDEWGRVHFLSLELPGSAATGR